MNLVRVTDPPPSLAQRKAAIKAIIGQMHAEGMTGVKDPLLQPDWWAVHIAILPAMKASRPMSAV